MSAADVGVVFDIDGVLMRDWHLIGRSNEALQRVKSELKLPFVFVTNGGGVPERKKQASLSHLLGIDVALDQVIICHTPFRAHLEALAPTERVLAVGLTDARARACARAYDVPASHIVTLEEIVNACPGIDCAREAHRGATGHLCRTPRRARPLVAVWCDFARAAV
jgi:HAD superfamily hydrolase (TIGR01450 family)